MRTRIVKDPWFGPKSGLGWGWTPRSWKGWLTTVVFVVLVIPASAMRPSASLLPVIVLLAIYLLIIVLTGDPPGRADADRDA